MYTLRTRFVKDLVAEFLPPRKKSRKVVILCDGMPAVPAKRELINFLSKKGFWVFAPRYRGTWESGGEFLKRSPHEDIIDVIDALPLGFADFWSEKKFILDPAAIYLVASSFGGAAALCAAMDPRVTKVVAFSPVTDWQAPSKDEPLDWLERFVRNAFGNGYRFSSNWKKLGRGNFFNPISFAPKIDGKKVLIIHAKDDRSVPWRFSRKFARVTGSELAVLDRGGHMGMGLLMKPRFWKRAMKFIKK